MAPSADFEKGVEKNEIAQKEESILAFWKERDIFKKSLKKTASKGEFVFYEGPPTANGRPGVHHMESRSFKDAVPRYKTMRGYHVARRAGWDTHGLPVELEVEKELNFSGKKDIEAYGIAAFNKKCRESVMKYIEEWDRFTKRIGYWVDQETAYFTFDASYMESVWNLMKKIFDDGRLYKDYKIVPWCSRCGTALSSHELAQGYADVKDLSVTVKFELVEEPGTYFLAWTTTPWTLPGNVGLAVGKDIEYVKVKRFTGEWDEVGKAKYDQVIVARDRFEFFKNNPANTAAQSFNFLFSKTENGQEVPTEATIVASLKGGDLAGKEYKPLYTFAEGLSPESEKQKFTDSAFRVYTADFVTTEDGTGIVHTAVMYGQEDFDLGQKEGLPKVHLVGADGKFIPGTGFLEGRFVKEKDENGKPTLAVDIIDDLKKRDLFFSQENHLHSYPFCWRCKTPLIYYARDSWYIRMQDLKEQLVANNNRVNWEPAHIRSGRMGEWIANVKDWAISRERYWGTPLPVWQSEDGTERIAIGSIDELKSRAKKAKNTYFIMRHGQAENNVLAICSTHLENQTDLHLTHKGREEATMSAKTLTDKKIDYIFYSPFTRTHDTALVAAEVLGVPKEHVIVDERLREIDVGVFERKPISDYRAYFASVQERFIKAPEGAETFTQVSARAGEFLYELEAKYEGKNILIVSHGDVLWLLKYISAGVDRSRLETLRYPETAGVEELVFVPLPHNDNYELDLHRPYIDDLVLLSDSGKELKRVPEVMDVWFDSGAMPFAQVHYPFEHKDTFDKKEYPADFISEAIDQTRGWFYTLLAVGTLVGREAPYKNVICLGHLLDAEGQKMSKSKGNVINPWEVIERYGVDTLRFWMYSVNQPGDSKNFDEKTVKEAARVISWLDNSTKFYRLFAETREVDAQETALDVWMRVRVNETIEEVTRTMDAYKLYEASRTTAKLIEDLSQWYIRRVRDRVRDGDAVALRTLKETLRSCALLLAPLTPFIAEEVFLATKRDSDPESVHLAAWPTVSTSLISTLTGKAKRDQQLVTDMAAVRAHASEALMLRQKAGVKVRQPLASLSITGALPEPLADILKDELNVKEIIQNASEMLLDTKLTPELIREGDVREFVRAIADARKTMGLSPKDTVHVVVEQSASAQLSGVSVPGVSSVGFAGSKDAPYEVTLSTGLVHFSVTHHAT